MTPLSSDYARCEPDTADSWCRKCKRWAEHPNQTFGEWQAFFACEGSQDENCAFIPEDENAAQG